MSGIPSWNRQASATLPVETILLYNVAGEPAALISSLF